eukprot:PhF_6_TR25603/c0_g1_i1/m.35921/K14570/REX1, REXO1, RNH70; RNA exonuclease 1
MFSMSVSSTGSSASCPYGDDIERRQSKPWETLEDETASTSVCECPPTIEHCMELTMHPNSVLCPEDLQKFILAVFQPRGSLVCPPQWLKFPEGKKPDGVILIVAENTSGTRERLCPKHQFKLKLRNIVRDTKTHVFCEEFFTTSKSKAGEAAIVKRIRLAEETGEPCQPNDLLLSKRDMIKSGFRMSTVGSNFVSSGPRPPALRGVYSMVAMDCEMVMTTAGKLELARVSLVDCGSKETVYDEFVKPENAVTNYLTMYSGITRDILEPVSLRLSDVQRELLSGYIFEDTILVGHSIVNDLEALQLVHHRIIDVSLLYPRNESVPVGVTQAKWNAFSLKMLTATLLGRAIQNDPERGHSSVEDAKACADLLDLKLAYGLKFGLNLKTIGSVPNGSTFLRDLLRNAKCEIEVQTYFDDTDMCSVPYFNQIKQNSLTFIHEQTRPASGNPYFAFIHLSNVVLTQSLLDTARMTHQRNTKLGSPPPAVIVVSLGLGNSVLFC